MNSKIEIINGMEVHNMNGYLSRNCIELYFTNEYEESFLVNKLIKIDKKRGIKESRYLLNVEDNVYIKIKGLDDRSMIALNGMGKLRKGTGYTKIMSVW